ncbi:MAG: hypothetical protein CMK09_10485 [Ponticaulis sp.]|nr:hypothetical protein [Ponticaulis sp.]|tara:strand:- start:2257 stop:3078 length:822 start_codon:yes stop_codon:yes gene_type:complete
MSEETPSVSLDMLATRLGKAEDELLVALEKRTMAAKYLRDALEGDGNPLSMAIITSLERMALQGQTGNLDELLLRWAVEFQMVMADVGLERVFVTGSEPLRIFDQARSIFGHRVPMSFEKDPRDTLTFCLEQPSTAGVLGWMTQAGSGQWWPALNESRYHDLRIIGGWPVIGGEAPLAAIVSKGPLTRTTTGHSVLMAHDDQHRLKRIFSDLELETSEFARARSLVLFKLSVSLSETDPRLTSARSAGLDGLRVVGTLPDWTEASHGQTGASA